MPKCSMTPPQADDRRRDDVAPVDDRRGAGDEDEAGLLRRGRRDRRREIGDRMGAAPLAGERAAERGEAGPGDLDGLVEDALLEAGQPRLDEAGGEGRQRRDAQQAADGGGDRAAALDDVARRGEGNDLDRRHHLLRLDERVGRQRRQRHRFVDEVERVERVAVDDAEPVRIGEEVDAAGEGIGRA